MKERPILFSGPMVRALIDGSKTQTRRIVRPRPWTTGNYFASGEYLTDLGYEGSRGQFWAGFRHPTMEPDSSALFEKSPYGPLGDRLYVRETWAQPTALDPGPTVYRADYPACVLPDFENIPPVNEITWKPSIHMPRALSRLTLEVTGVRVERLTEISEDDAIAEGIEKIDTTECGNAVWKAYDAPDCGKGYLAPSYSYMTLWNSINAARDAPRGLGWDTNPWVWVVEFKRID